MVLRFFLLATIFLLISCTDFKRDNPYDPDGINYVGDEPSSSSNVEPPPPPPSSSSSSVPSSSSVVPVVPSSSSVASPPPSSSSSSSRPSSSSVAPVVPSSSSVPTQSGIVYGTPASYENETYQTVVIGTQTWMARNLNYAAPGSKCGNGSSLSDENTATCNTYGRLYNWATAMALDASCNSTSCASQVGAKHQGICPSGWHIPSDAEWTTLTDHVGASIAGTKLKATSGWNSNGNGQDTYGFAALPGGDGYSDGSFSNVDNYGYWWSATEDNANYAYYRDMGYDYEDVSRNYNYKYYGLFSVRCLQD
ncbi:MAG: hypothetical protein LBC75_10655 [Fibromonadaceae bacterium]|jgi:uncharacterized protein (TIGR02145 family)|nr:hypothetical protein [Fibromonadaceae bacterium]